MRLDDALDAMKAGAICRRDGWTHAGEVALGVWRGEPFVVANYGEAVAPWIADTADAVASDWVVVRERES